MFQNNNKQIEKCLAHRSFHAEKRKNVLCILTVAIAVGMMTALALLPSETLQAKKNEEEGTPQATFSNVSQSAVSELKNSSDVEWVGEQTMVASAKTGDYTLTEAYCDQTMLNASKLTIKGAIPTKSDEILLEQPFLTHIGSKAKAGESILLDLGNGQKKYKITGVLDSNSGNGKNYAVIVSKAYAQEKAKTGSLKTNAYLRIRNADGMSDEDLDQAIYSLADKTGIAKKDVSVAISEYRMIKKNAISNLFGLAVVAAVILLGSAIVIYSIFYISVTGKIHEYGRLRTIGTTKKQIKGIVYREGFLISAVGIPIGLVTGSIVGYFLSPKGWNLANTLWTAVITCMIGFLSVQFSIRTPVQIAASTSPIETARYTAYKEKGSRKKSRKITPFHLAVTNLSRNRKKSVLTLLSLGFSGILLVCAATLSVSYSAYDEAKPEFPYGSYKISLSTKNMGDDDFAVNKIQTNNPLNKQLKDKILSIKGVKEIREWSSTAMQFKMPNGRESGGTAEIYAFSSDEIEKMKPYLVEGQLDYPSMASQNRMAVCYPQSYKENYGWYPKLGDQVKCALLNSKGETVERTFTVTALMNGNYREKGPYFWVPIDTMNELAGMKTIRDFEIVTEDKNQDAIGNSLKAIAKNNPHLEYSSLKDTMENLQKRMQPNFNVMYILIAFISLFGIINLINTSITNLLAQKREIGIMQAVGLSGKQLNRMLQTEGVLYTAGTAIFTMTVGTAFGYAVYRILKSLGMALHYHYPVIPVCIFIAVLLMIQVFISTFTVRNLKKQSLVDRIRQAE